MNTDVWADHAAFVINTYANYAGSVGYDEIEFSDLHYPNSRGEYARINCRLYRLSATKYIVRFVASGRHVHFRNSENGMINDEVDQLFFRNADGVDFRDYLSRCRIRAIRVATLRNCRKLHRGSSAA